VEIRALTFDQVPQLWRAGRVSQKLESRTETYKLHGRHRMCTRHHETEIRTSFPLVITTTNSSKALAKSRREIHRHNPLQFQFTCNLSLQLQMRRTFLLVVHHVLQTLEGRFANKVVVRVGVVGGGTRFERENVWFPVLCCGVRSQFQQGGWG
jgi:hypothetical protein